jgi:hypothetical protein
MGWFRRRGGDPPQVVVHNYIGEQEQGPRDPLSRVDGSPPAAEKEVLEAARRIAHYVSLRNRFATLMKEYGWVTAVLIVASILVLPNEWYIAIGSAIVANLLVYAYTKWTHVPPVAPVIKFNDVGSGPDLGIWAFPTEMWGDIAKSGLSNTVRTNLGMAYVVDSITWGDDEQEVPVAVQFAWIHINFLNFATKREVFPKLVKAVHTLTSENNTLKLMMQTITFQKAIALATRWLDVMANGRDSALAGIDKITLERDLERIAKERQELDLPGPSGDETQEFSEPGTV